MSWFSAAFTRAKGAITGAVSIVPVVGGALAGAINNIHTGDEHYDQVTGTWVNNSTGMPTVGPPTAALQAEIDRVNRTNTEIYNLARQSAADSAARIGGGLSLEAAARLGPEGNVYQKALNNPFALVGGMAVLGLLVYLALRK